MNENAFKAITTGAMAEKQLENIKIRQGREIRELNEQLKSYIKDISTKETQMRVIIEKNNQAI